MTLSLEPLPAIHPRFPTECGLTVPDGVRLWLERDAGKDLVPVQIVGNTVVLNGMPFRWHYATLLVEYQDPADEPAARAVKNWLKARGWASVATFLN